MMVALLVYAYCVGIRSSRKIEQACQENVAFRVITGGKVPDHTTIARFRQSFEGELSELFTEVLWLCGKAGLVRVGTVVVQDQNDVRQLHPMLEKVEEELAGVGIEKRPKVAMADAGYFSEENLKKGANLELVVAPRSEGRLAQLAKEVPPPRGRIPKGVSQKDLMERKLLTKRGRGLYKLRKLVEP